MQFISIETIQMELNEQKSVNKANALKNKKNMKKRMCGTSKII